MDERVLQFRVGIVVLSAGIITGILILVFGAAPRFGLKEQTLYIEFPAAPGVNVDTPVRKSGIPIGRVSNVELLENGRVELTLRVDDRYKLRLDEVCRIGMASLVTGDATLEFVPKSDKTLLVEFDENKNGRLDDTELTASKQFLQPGDFLSAGKVTSDPLNVLVDLSGDMSNAFAAIQLAGENVAKTVENVNQVFGGNQEDARRLLTKTEQALDNFNTALAGVNTFVGDPELNQQLKESLTKLPGIMRQVEQTLDVAKVTLATFDRVGQRAENNLANLEDLTEPLAENADQIVGEIRGSIKSLSDALDQLAEFGDLLNSSDGTIGKLVRDDEMYKKINRTVTNIEDITRRLRPIMDDVRVFTDKISRDPRQIGVKGALDRRPSGTGFNY